MKTVFSAKQRRIIYGCVGAYTLAYLIRLNLSATLSGIMETMGIAAAQAGALQTCFALVYAGGQLVSGAITDRVNPVRYMLLGLGGSAGCNLLFGLAGEYWQLLALCLLNGAFQSMLWTPIVRLVALHFPQGPGRVRANFLLSLTLVAGHLGAWGLSGFLSSALRWQWAYILPACFTGLMTPLLFLLLRCADEKGAPGTEKGQRRTSVSFARAARLFAKTGFLLILPGCVLYGFARDGIVTWTPELLHSMAPQNGGLAASFSLIIPAMNFLGILLGYFFRSRGRKNDRSAVAAMLLGAALFSALLLPVSSLAGAALLTGLACAGLYGLNPILTSLIPMEYDRLGLVGLAAGLVDSFIYLGSALSGLGEGLLYQAFGREGLFLSWLAAALCGAALMALSAARRYDPRGISQDQRTEATPHA